MLINIFYKIYLQFKLFNSMRENLKNHKKFEIHQNDIIFFKFYFYSGLITRPS